MTDLRPFLPPRFLPVGVTFWVLGLPLLLVCGCDRETGVPGSPDPESGEPITVDIQPFLVLGSMDGDPDQEFYRVRPPFLLPGGRVAIPLGGDSEIRVFSPEGQLVASYGGPGEGPGEFQYLSRAWARGDTIEAFDSRLLRITRFGPDGGVETVELDRAAAGFSLDSAVPGSFGDGWALFGITGFGDDRRDQIAVARFSRAGDYVETVVKTEGILRDEAGRGPEPLSPSVSFALLNDALFLGETLTPRILSVDTLGGSTREVSWIPDPQSPREALRQVVELALERAGPDQVDRLQERLESMPVPVAVPLFSAFMVDELGFLWLRPYEVERDAAALGGPLYATIPPGGIWWVFSPDGSKTGSVELPPDLKPSQITAEAIVGVREDELGLEYVQLHRLRRR